MKFMRYLCVVCLAISVGCDSEGSGAESGAGAAVAGMSGGAPVGGEPAGGEPAGGEPAGGEPAGGEPAGGAPVGGEPVGGEPVGGEPVGGEPVGGEPVGGAPAGGEPVTGTHVYPGAVEGQLILSNAPRPCEQRTTISPYLPDEAGHHAASLLTPSSYPFTVSAVEYTLEEPPDIMSCKSELAHRIELTVLGAAQAPLAAPATEARAHRSVLVPQAMMPTERRVILQGFEEEPLVLNEGERLLVSISLAAEGADHLCIAACEDEPARRGMEFWSNAESAPYDWVELGTFGLTTELMISVIGR